MADKYIEYRYAWTSDANGAYTLVIPTHHIMGILSRVRTIPGTGTDAPSAAYDVTLVDKDGVDLFFGYGLNRSATVTEDFVPVIPQAVGSTGLVTVAVAGPVTLTIANAGALNTGTVVIIVEK